MERNIKKIKRPLVKGQNRMKAAKEKKKVSEENKWRQNLGGFQRVYSLQCCKSLIYKIKLIL